jgi:hypothetical protein
VTFAWAYLDEAGEDLGSSDEFADREAAENWMGECWQDLLERGVDQVALVDRERHRRVYRMGLRSDP